MRFVELASDVTLVRAVRTSLSAPTTTHSLFQRLFASPVTVNDAEPPPRWKLELG